MRTKFNPAPWSIALAATLAFSTPLASALNIVMVETSTADAPASDPGGANLAAMMEHVAETWESLILDSQTVTIEFAYNDDIDGWASAAPDTFHANGRTETGHVNVNPDIDWWFDGDPTTHENFTMLGALYRDLTTEEKGVRFNQNDTPPDMLEISYRGASIASTPASGKADAYTSLLHEIGHVLGMHGHFSNSSDTDVETDSVFTGGNDFRAIFNEATDDDGNLVIQRGHFEWNLPSGRTYTNNPLMCGGCAELDARRLPTAQDVICIASLGLWDTIDLPRKDFVGTADTDFNTSGNWIGNRVPDAGDEAYCRHGGIVTFSGDAEMKTLFIGSLTFVETEGHDIVVNGDTTIEPDQGPPGFLKPLLIIEDNSHMETSDFFIRADTIVDLKEGSDLDVNDDLTNEGLLKGDGTITVSDGFWNDGGTISPDWDGTLTLIGGPNGINLDGRLDANNEENGVVDVDDGDLNVLSPLTDDFGGEMTILQGRAATFSGGWTLGTNGLLEFFGGPEPDGDDRAMLAGSGRYRGEINVNEEAAIFSDSVIISLLDGRTYYIEHTFASDVTVNLTDPTDRLAIFGAEIEAGATFDGAGVLLNGQGSFLDLHDGAVVGVKLTNGGRELGIGGSGTTGDATAQRLNLLEIGTVRFDINGLPDSGDFDHISAVEDARCRGALVVAFNGLSFPPDGSRWRIIDAATRDGVFTEVEITGLGFGRSARVEYFNDGVDVVIEDTPLLSDFIVDIPTNVGAGTRYPLPTGQGSGLNGRIVSDNPKVVGAVGEMLEFRSAGVANVRFELLDENGHLQVEEIQIVVASPATTCGLEAQLLHSGGQIDDQLGHSCALSGNIAVGGAPTADPGGLVDAGLGVIWERQAGIWVEVATLLPAGLAAGDRAGDSVAVDGDIVLLGAPGTAGGNGEVWVYRRAPGGAWATAANLLTPVVQAGRGFGSALAVAGNFAFIGAPGDNGAGANAGAVFVFERTAPGTWSPHSVVRGSNTAAGHRFGTAIDWDGGMLAVGAPGAAGNTGTTYRFEVMGGAFVEQDILILTTGAPGDLFGQSVAIDASSSLLFAGAPGRSTAGLPQAGAVGMFEAPAGGGAWTETGLVELPAPAAGDRFGSAVAAGDCDLLASAPGSDALLLNGGAIHRLGANAGTWAAGAPRGTPDQRPGDQLGISLSADGPQWAAGSRRDDDRTSDAGAVYVWREGAGSGGNNFIAQGDPADWLGDLFPGGDPFAGRLDIDDDNDGRSRLLEYLQGGSPLGHEPSGTSLGDNHGSGKRLFRFRMARRAMQSYRLRMEWTEDGTHWSEDPKLPIVEDEGAPETVNLVWEADDQMRRAIGRVRVDGKPAQNLSILTNNENILTNNEN